MAKKAVRAAKDGGAAEADAKVDCSVSKSCGRAPIDGRSQQVFCNRFVVQVRTKPSLSSAQRSSLAASQSSIVADAMKADRLPELSDDDADLVQVMVARLRCVFSVATHPRYAAAGDHDAQEFAAVVVRVSFCQHQPSPFDRGLLL